MAPSPHGTHITFYRLLLTAYQARERMRRKDADSSNDPAIAVLLSVTAVEAMLGELAQISAVAHNHQFGSGSALHENLRRYAVSHHEVVQGREQNQTKKLLNYAMHHLSGNTVDWGKYPFQDFDLLIKLRNDIAHGNLGELVMLDEDGKPRPDRSKLIVELQRKGLIHCDRGNPQATRSSFEMAMTSELADWAIKITRRVVQDVMTPSHLSEAGPELQALFCLNSTFPLLLMANGIADDFVPHS